MGDISLLMYVKQKLSSILPKQNKKDLVMGSKTTTHIDYRQTEEFTEVTSDNKWITFTPQKRNVGEYIVIVSTKFESMFLNFSASYKVRVKVLDILPPPPTIDTLG